MIGVHFCGPTNSTFFTNCCRVAICDDQSRCPSCSQEVYPGEDQADHKRRSCRWNMAFENFNRRHAK